MDTRSEVVDTQLVVVDTQLVAVDIQSEVGIQATRLEVTLEAIQLEEESDQAIHSTLLEE